MDYIIYENMSSGGNIKVINYLPTCDGGCHKNEYLNIIVHSVSCISKYNNVISNFSLDDEVDTVKPYINWTVCIHDNYHHNFPYDSCFCIKQLIKNIELLESYNHFKTKLNNEIQIFKSFL
jgi:hypothetical protein